MTLDQENSLSLEASFSHLSVCLCSQVATPCKNKRTSWDRRNVYLKEYQIPAPRLLSSPAEPAQPASFLSSNMDHLPRPGSATGRRDIVVPYVCQEEYDGGEFMTYPSRRGSLPHLHTVGVFPGQLLYSHQMRLASLSKREIESFYQTWLFFGLIREILGSLYVAEDLIYTCEGANPYPKAVSTSKLVLALDTWIARAQAGTVDPPVTYAHVAQCLCLTHAALSVQAIRSSFDKRIMLSLASLGQTFTYAANKAFNITDVVKDNRCSMTWLGLLDASYWQGRLLAQGWCVSEMRLVLDTTMSLQTLHFLACLDKTDSKESHQQCDSRQCTAYQNDLGRYQTQHVSKECDCREFLIKSEALYNILKTGALPLIRVKPSQTLGELSVDIVASRPTSRYVAISHVWADGLGNPYANALPRCQLSNLGKLTQDLDVAARARDVQDHHVEETDVQEHEELLLWCDTLCCPVQPEEAKRLALKYMYRTYLDATHVLVLDASLRRYNVESLDIDEWSMRILTSPWMRRLWTLQEGALPAVTNRLWFQLAHKAVNLRELRMNARDKIFSSISRRGLALDMFKRISSFSDISFEKNSTRPQADLGKVIEALHHRSVSIPSDEPLLIGNLLGLDAAQILNGKDDAVSLRMNRLWRLMSSALHGIPSNILFRAGQRLAEPGLRWAPATLLAAEDPHIYIESSESENEQGILTPSDGLLVHLHGFRLSLASPAKGLPSLHKSIAQLDDPNRLCMKDDAGSWCLMRRNLPVKQDSFLTNKTLAETILESENMWIVHPGSKFPRNPNSKAQSLIGLIVKVETGGTAEKEEKGFKKAYAKLHVKIGQVGASASAWFALATKISAQLASDSPALRKLAAIENDLAEHSLSSSSSSLKTIALQELASEIHQMAANEETKEAIVAAGNKFDVIELENLITTVLWGQYVCMQETTPKTQRWCVD